MFAGTKAGQERDDNALKLKLCWCPPGAFTMGSPASEPDRSSDEDQVQVTLTTGFWLGKFEVTQAQWAQVMAATLEQQRNKVDSSFSLYGQGANYPIYYVSHDEATEFCRRLTESERQSGRLPADWEYRLPTEAQWEYACRAGTTTATAFGKSLVASQANFDGSTAYNTGSSGVNLGRTAIIGSYPPNVWGLHDMHGNVWEWCRDWYRGRIPGGMDPEVSSGASNRVLRGGGWMDSGHHCRSACRGWNMPRYGSQLVGLRVAAVQLVLTSTTASKPSIPPDVATQPFDATRQRTPTEAQSAQSAWARKLGIKPIEKSSANIELILIPPGEFLMGAPNSSLPSERQAPVTIAAPFYLLAGASTTLARREAVPSPT